MDRSSSVALSISLILALTAGSLTTVTSAQSSPWEQVIVFPLLGADGVMTKLAITEYDLSIAGFTNRTGHWHAFPEHKDRIPNSTPLPFDNSISNLPSLPLGRVPMGHAARVLNNHDPATAGDDGVVALKRALAALTVMITEAQRLTPVKDAVEKGWDSGDARVAAEHLPYIEHWDAMCHEIVRANKNGGVWDGPFTELLKEKANIHSLEDTLSVVSVVGHRTIEQVLMAHARSA